jgi:hypothetical protein
MSCRDSAGPSRGINVFFIFLLIPGLLGAFGGQDLNLANRYYDMDDYSRAFVHFQDLILLAGRDGTILSGDNLYRYGYCYERLRGLDGTALTIYALSRYYNGKEGRQNSPYAEYAAGKLKAGQSPLLNLDAGEAASLMAGLRETINQERKNRLYRYVDRLYGYFSRFSLFQWKIIISAAAALPLLIGIVAFRAKKKIGPAP